MSIPFYIFAWAASILYGCEAVLVKLIGKHSIPNPWLFNFVWALFILIFMTPFALWNGVGLPASWPFIIYGSVFYALAGVFYTVAVYNLDLSVASPLFNFRTAISVILGAVFLGEILTVKQYILIAIIFIFGIVVSLDENFKIKSFFRKGVAIMILCLFSVAIVGVFIKKSAVLNGYWDTTIWIAVIGQVWLLATVPLFKKDIKKISAKQYGATIITAVAGTAGTLAANAAYTNNISISTAIIALPFSMIAAFIFARVAPALLEHHTTKVYVVRFVGAAIMILAALNL